MDAKTEHDTSSGVVAVDTASLFLTLSARLTGYSEEHLLRTGMSAAHYDHLMLILGSRQAGAFFGAVEDAASFGDGSIEGLLKDPISGPVARNIMRMWYLGTWRQLPRHWRDECGATSLDTDHVVSAAAYRASLVWPTAGTHPMGADQPGFGSWAVPPPGAERSSS